MSEMPKKQEVNNGPTDRNTLSKPTRDQIRRRRSVAVLSATFLALFVGFEAHDPQTIPRGLKSIANYALGTPTNPANDLPSLSGLNIDKVSPLEVEFTEGTTFRYSPVKKDGPNSNLGLNAKESFRIPVTAPVTVIRKYGEDDGWVGVETKDVIVNISRIMGSDPETRDSFASYETLHDLFEVAAKDNSGVIWFRTEDSTPLYGGDSTPPDQFDIPPYATPEEPQSYSIVFSRT